MLNDGDDGGANYGVEDDDNDMASRCKLNTFTDKTFHSSRHLQFKNIMPILTLKSNFLINFVLNSLFKGLYGGGWTCLSTLAQKNQSKLSAVASKNERHCWLCVVCVVCGMCISAIVLCVVTL